jgi:hypothetical protein
MSAPEASAGAGLIAALARSGSKPFRYRTAVAHLVGTRPPQVQALARVGRHGLPVSIVPPARHARLAAASPGHLTRSAAHPTSEPTQEIVDSRASRAAAVAAPLLAVVPHASVAPTAALSDALTSRALPVTSPPLPGPRPPRIERPIADSCPAPPPVIEIGATATLISEATRPPGYRSLAPLGAAPLRAAPLGAAPLGATPLGAAPLGATPLGATPPPNPRSLLASVVPLASPTRSAVSTSLGERVEPPLIPLATPAAPDLTRRVSPVIAREANPQAVPMLETESTGPRPGSAGLGEHAVLRALANAAPQLLPPLANPTTVGKRVTLAAPALPFAPAAGAAAPPLSAPARAAAEARLHSKIAELTREVAALQQGQREAATRSAASRAEPAAVPTPPAIAARRNPPPNDANWARHHAGLLRFRVTRG